MVEKPVDVDGDDGDEDEDDRIWAAVQRKPPPAPPSGQAKRRLKGPDPFVRLPLWWAAQAATATHTAKAMVWVWLVYLSWKAHHHTFVAPNGALEKCRVSRDTKLRA
jgi:hypothetical protein